MKYFNCLKVILNLYLILFFLFGWTAPVFAQEATSSAKEILSASEELVNIFSIPKLPLPFEGKFVISAEESKGVVFNVKADKSEVAIKAVEDGEVVLIEDDGKTKTVTISHTWGESIYSLLDAVTVNTGQTISKEQQIASSNTSFVFFGIKPKIPHLDAIEGYIDPLPYLPDSIKEDVLGALKEIATASAVLTTFQADNIASDSAYLFNYKFDLNKGTTAHFFDKATQRPSLAIADENYNYKLRFFLNQDASQSAQPQVEGNKVEFPVTVGGISMTLRYTIDGDKVKEEFIIDQKPSQEILASQGQTLQIPFTISSEGLTREKKEQGYEFKSENGTIVWRIFNPTVEDSKGKKGSSDEVYLNIEDTKAILGVKTEFLKNASYPIIIDPTWTQTDWSGGSGQTSWSDTTKYDSASSVTTSTAGQATLTNSEKLSNTTFETNTTSWNTGAQPNTVSGVKAWTKADAITGLSDGNAVTTWSDSSGNSTDFTQSTTTSKPTYKTNILNSLPVVRYDGGDVLSSVVAAVLNVFKGDDIPNTVIGVFKASTSSTMMEGVSAYHSSGQGYAPIRRHVGNSWRVLREPGGGATEVTDGASDNNFHIISVPFTGTTVSLFLDGAATGIAGSAMNTAALSALTTVSIGSFNGQEFWTGDIAEVIIYDASLSTTNRSRIENYLRDKYAITVSSGITSAARSTEQFHGGAASAKLVTSSANTGEFTQTVNVGDTNTYNLSAYAYTTGAAVTSSDVELFYNGSTVTTTYTSAGGGWYQLTGTVTGANASRIYGVQVKAGKTVYVDDMSVNNYAASGTLTSSIFDSSQRSDWGTLTYNATTPSNTTVSVKARTSNASDMTGATAFSSCTAITSGADISSNSCVTDTQRYIQYQFTVTNSSTEVTPTFLDVSIVYTLSVPVAPSSLSGSAASTTSITWSWTDNSSDEDGFYVLDTSNNIKCTVSSANITTCTETGLSPDTSYTRKVVAFNASGNSSASSNATAVTLSTAPTTSNISSSPATSTWTNNSTFTFTNNIGFGAGGVEYFRYAWDTSSTHSWSGSESQWTSGTLSQTATSDSNSWYLHLKAYNSNNTENGTLDLGPFYFDATSPNSFDLTSPSDGVYIGQSRPTFTWKAALIEDVTSGLSSYKLQIQDSSDAVYINIDSIPTSGTTDYSTSQYVVHYENFGDADSTNNYISIYTKSSSQWGSGANDGALKEGKNTWTITAVDRAGNTRGISRVVYADYASPTLSNISVENIGEKDGYLVATTTTPKITGTITDSVAPDKIVFNFYKHNFILGIETGQSLVLTTTKDLENTNNHTYLDFSFTSSSLDYGKYTLKLIGYDKAGNTTEQTLNFQLMSVEEAQKLLQLTEEDKIQLKESGISLTELEKKAILRREKEAGELDLFLQALRGLFGEVYDVVAQGVSEADKAFRGTLAFVSSLSEKWLNESYSYILALLQNTQSVWIAVQNEAIKAGNFISYQIANILDNASKSTTKAVASVPIVGQFIVELIQTKGEEVYTQISQINQLALDYLSSSQDRVVKQIAIEQKTTNTSVQQIGSTLSFLTDTVTKVMNTSQNNIKDQISQTNQQTSQTITYSISKLAQVLENSQQNTKNQIAQRNESTSVKIAQAGEAMQIVWRSLQKPVTQATDFLGRVKIGVFTFQAIVFDKEPTRIADVTIEEIGPDFAVVSWKTNHYASGKVNYGKDLSYGEEVVLDKREKYHQARLVGLKPGERVFFEVMSQNKNYAYDAYYSFETLTK